MAKEDSKGVLRRQFIASKLANTGFVTYAEIQSTHENITRQQLRIDARILRRNGIDIESAMEGRNGLFFSPGAPFPATYNLRKNHHLYAKQRISIVAKYLALSNKVHSVIRIQRALKSRLIGGDERTRERLIEKIYNHSIKKERRMFLDGGTTTSQIAERLLEPDPEDTNKKSSSGDHLPATSRTATMEQARVAVMEIWTNNRHVFYRLGHPRCQYNNIAIIGGHQMARTAAVCGVVANRFASELLPPIDISFLGASMISTTSRRILIGNSEEAELKRIIMGRSAFNIVVADSSKFSQFDSGYVLSSLDQPSQVDMIITDIRPKVSDCQTPIFCVRRK